MDRLSICINLKAISKADIADIRKLIHTFYQEAQKNHDPLKSILMCAELPSDERQVRKKLCVEQGRKE